MELWLDNVQPILMHLDKTRKSIIQSSIVICNEVLLLSCIEDMLNHEMILMQAEEFLPELIEYCYRRILILESFSKITEEMEKKKIQSFVIGIKAVAIIACLIEHKSTLSEYIYSRIVKTLDIPIKLIQLICDSECKKCIEDVDAHLLRNKDVIVPNKRKMTEIEKKIWNMIYAVLLDGEYPITEDRKPSILKLLSFLTDDVIQELPKLKNLAQFIEVTKIFGASKIKLDLFIPKAPVIYKKLKDDNRNKWTDLAWQEFVQKTLTEAELIEFFKKLQHLIPPSLNYEMERALQLINSQGSLSQENIILNVLPPQPTPVATQRCVISAQTLSEALQAVIKTNVLSKNVPLNIKGVDPKLAQVSMDEIVNDGPSVISDDIDGEEVAKQALRETAILPTVCPQGGKRRGGKVLTEEFVKKLKRKHEDEVNKYNEEIKKLKEKLYLKVATALLMREEGTSEPLRKKIKLEEKKLLYIVLDTNILVNNLPLVRLLLQDGIKVDDRSPILCLSVVVIKELDKLKTIKETEDRARSATDFIARRMQSNDKVVKQHYTELLFMDTVVKISNDEKILVWSIKLKKRIRADDELTVLTNDKNMSVLIEMAEIPVQTAKQLMSMLKNAAGIPILQSPTSSNKKNQKKKK